MRRSRDPLGQIKLCCINICGGIYEFNQRQPRDHRGQAENDVLVGYGMWKKEYMLGIASINSEIYLKIGREWAKQNTGGTGKVRFPNIVCNEITWLEEIVPLNRTPESYKPLKPGDDISTRKIWTYIVTFSLDDYKTGVDAVHGE